MSRILLLLCLYFLFVLPSSAGKPYWKTGNGQLNQVLNLAIYQLWTNGEIEQIYSTWFGLACIYQPPCFDSKVFIPYNATIGTLRHIIDSGEIRFGSDLKKPMLFRDDNGLLRGSEYDLSVAIARVLSELYGVNITARWVTFNSTTNFFVNVTRPMIENNECDAVLSYMSNNPERNKTVSFTCPYSPQSVVTIIRGESEPERNFTSLSDFNDPYVFLGVKAGSIYEDYRLKYLPLSKAIPSNASPDRGYSKLRIVHGIIDDIQPVQYYLLQNLNSSCFTSRFWNFPEAAPYFSIATRKDEPEEVAVASSESLEEDHSSNGAIIGSIISVGLVILAVVIVVAILLKKRRDSEPLLERGVAVPPISSKPNSRKNTDVKTDEKPKNEKRAEPAQIQFSGSPISIPSNRTSRESQYGVLVPMSYTKVCTLGKGHFGEVYKVKRSLPGASHQLSNEYFAAKVVAEDFEQEVATLKDLSHQNIVTFYEAWRHEEKRYIICEFIDGVTLDKHVSSKELSSNELLRIILEIAYGMEYLETKKMVHRDLALRNIMISVDGRVKIIDFGLTRGNELHITGSVLPKDCMAPEVEQERTFTHKADVFSFGIVMWRIYSKGVNPIGNNLERKYEIVKKFEKPIGCPESVFALIKRCTNMDPQMRPTFAEVVQELQKCKDDV